jgi:hypothetical protein
MKRAIYFIALLVVASVKLASAQFQCLSYQGTLRTGGSSGALVTGNHNVTFRIYNAATGGAAIWTETISGVAFSRGVFTVLLGDPSRTPSVPLNLFFDRTYWLGISIDGGTELTPRVILCAAPYSFNAKAVRGVLSSSNIFPTDGSVGIGTTSPVGSAKLDVRGGSSSHGIRGESPAASQSAIIGVHTSTGEAVSGYSSGGTGVGGYSSGTGQGVSGYTNGSGAGVRASNGGTGPAVQATNNNNTGIPGATIRAVNSNTSGGIAGYFETNGADGTMALISKGTGVLLKGFGANGGEDEFRFDNDGTLRFFDASFANTIKLSPTTGRTTTKVLEITGGSDLSEQFEVNGVESASREASPEPLQPGMVVSIDAQNAGKLVVCNQAYDRKVAGIISGAGGIKTGMLMGQSGSSADGSTPIALAGRVYCWADASQDAIEPGDLLTTSDTPGHAMKVTDHAKSQGAIIGKAMTGLAQGKGLVLVLVTLQ